MVEEVIYQEHTYEIIKQPDVGFGIAISGGRDNPGVQSGDPAIIISDVVKHGPAFNKLQINDTVTRVNHKITYGMTHQQAVRELKNSGKAVLISVKRKAVVRVEQHRTPSPGALRRSRSRDLDDIHHSGRGRRRGSRDWSPKRHRSQSRGSAYHHRSRSRGRGTSRSRSRSRGRSYSRSHSRSSRHSRSRHRTPSRSSSSRSPSPPRKSRSPQKTRERSRSRSSRHRSVSRGRSSRSSSRSITPPRTLEKQKSVGELRSLSPLSPDPHGAKSDPDVMVFPVKPSEMRPVVLKKTRWNNSYGLKLGTRIFIQDIQPGSLADKNPELKRGDTIMMINGRNVDNKTVQEAIQIIGLSKDKLTMLVKSEDGGTVSIPAAQLAPPTPKEKERPKEKANVADNASSISHHSSASRGSTHSDASKKSDHKPEKKSERQREPEAEKKPEKKTFGGVRVMPEGIAAAVKEKSKPSYPESTSSRSSSQPSHTPEPAPRVKAAHAQPVLNQPLYDVPPSDEEDHDILPHDAHTVTFVKGRNVGIRLAGGNDVGIFVASVQEGSPAAKQGLKMGDQILSVNDQNFRNIIREEAVLALMGLPDGREVSIIAQPRPDVYQKILEHGTGDSFYIRTHFKYERANEHEMSFKQGSVFRISDTLYQGMVGYWLAVRIGRSNMEIERGVVPNGSRAQQLKEVQDKKIQQGKDKSQRSGIKRRLQGKGKNEKPPAITANSPHFPAYERVVLREAGFKRPVVCFGPLADIARQRLASDYPPNYQIATNDGIISGQKSNRKGIIRLNTIKDIIEKDKHAILDITPTAVEKLNYAQLYPIVVFLKPGSKGAVKELRTKLAVTEEEKKKKPGKLYDRAVKMQKGYGHVFTDTIPLGTVSDDWYRKLHSTIKDQQNMPVWVSEDKLGATTEEASEGMVIPGDDDRLSYVSAPASDYSVTTVGSEMLHNVTDMEDEMDERDRDMRDHRSPPTGGVALLPPIKRPPSSTSSSEEEEETGGKFGDDDLDDALKDDLDEEPPAEKPAPPSTREYVMPAVSPHIVNQPPVKADDRSSTSSEEHRPPPTRAPPAAAAPVKAAEPARGHQSMPEGRFDPDSFLKNHIKRLNKVRSEDNPPAQPRNEPQMSPRHVEPPQPAPQPSVVPKRAPEVETANRYQPPPQQPSSYARRDVPSAEPVYAQVDKGRRPPTHNEPPPQPKPQPQPQPQRAPGGYGDSYRKPPENTYNRFAGSSNPAFAPKSNPPPPRSNAYKGYTPRPYNKVTGPTGPSRIENGPSKDHMYDSGVDTHEKPKFVHPDHHAAGSLPGDNEDPQVVATARGVFDHDGGVLSSVETGVSIMIPKGAIPSGIRQEIYFKVCKDNTVLPPLDKDKGETLLSPLVMCGPHGLQFNHPVELRLPHCEPSQWQNMNMASDGGYQVSSNSVSVLIDHF